MPSSDITTVRDAILQRQRFVLTTHVNPDGDGLGSELALRAGLLQLGKSVTIVNYSPTPEYYRWLDPDGVAATYAPGVHAAEILAADALLVLDTNQPERLRAMADPVTSSAALKLVIDHHQDPHPFADMYYIDTEATSTGELIYRLLESFRGVSITREIAVALYTAIMTDTGSFRFPRTNAGTHTIISRLIECGADPPSIFSNVYETWSQGRMRLLGEALDTLTLSGGGAIAAMMTTGEMFARTGTTEVETDTFSTYPMNIQGVRIGILFTELKDGVKISFRSKGMIPVNLLAREFGGGGHVNASGARLYDTTFDVIVGEVQLAAEKYIDNPAS